MVTEGNESVQQKKLEHLGLDEYIKRQFIGTPFEDISKLNSYLDDSVLRRLMNSNLYNKYNFIKGEYVFMLEQYKEYFHSDVVSKVVRDSGKFKLAVIGDRYNIDLKPYDNIDKHNILQIAITGHSFYATQTEKEIKRVNSNCYIVKTLQEGLELLSTPEIWKGVNLIDPVKEEFIAQPTEEKIQDIRSAREEILKFSPSDPFIRYADEIINFYNKYN